MTVGYTNLLGRKPGDFKERPPDKRLDQQMRGAEDLEAALKSAIAAAALV